MFKRLRWLTVGALAGVGGSVWAQRRVRRAVERVMPAQISAQLRQRAGRVSEDLRASLSEGRSAMAEREAELRARLPDGVTPLPGARHPEGSSRRKGRVIDAVAVDDIGERLTGRAGGRHPSGGPPSPPAGAEGEESTVTELSSARRSRSEWRRR